MNKATLLNHINKIVSMTKDDLEVFARTVSVSEVDAKAKQFLERAIDVRFEQLNMVSVVAEEREMALFEYEE